MRILIINPPHPAIGSRIPREHLPPLGLLSVGGPLLDAGHEVKLVDAEFGPMAVPEIVREACRFGPDAVLLGHSGSTSGHPIAARIAQEIRIALRDTWIVYGGVFPTYHWATIMEQEPALDFIVRGEGEEAMVRLVAALQCRQELSGVAGIVFRAGAVSGVRRSPNSAGGQGVATLPAPIIRDLDSCRVGWELIDPRRYTYYGKRRAVVAQFSRGCPHHCSYCGQHGFWRAWRYRDPVKFAAELARLHREHGVEVINLADENPTASRPAWQSFSREAGRRLKQIFPRGELGFANLGTAVRPPHCRTVGPPHRNTVPPKHRVSESAPRVQQDLLLNCCALCRRNDRDRRLRA